MLDNRSTTVFYTRLEPTAKSARRRRGLPKQPTGLFNRLPLYIAKMDITLSAKLVFAEIATASFGQEKRFDYFKTARTIADTTWMSANAAQTAITELEKKELIWKTKRPSNGSRYSRSFYELAWTGDAETLLPNHKLKKTSAGKLTGALFRHSSCIPIFNHLGPWTKDSPANHYLQKYLNVFNPRSGRLDTYVLGYILAKAQPVFFRSFAQTARDLNIHRKTVSASFARLEEVYLIGRDKDGSYYPVAHPIFAEKPTKVEVQSIIEHVKAVRAREAVESLKRDAGTTVIPSTEDARNVTLKITNPKLVEAIDKELKKNA